MKLSPIERVLLAIVVVLPLTVKSPETTRPPENVATSSDWVPIVKLPPKSEFSFVFRFAIDTLTSVFVSVSWVSIMLFMSAGENLLTVVESPAVLSDDET